MNALDVTIDEWSSRVCLNPVLSTIARFENGYILGVASYYDFMNRIYQIDDSPISKSFKKKPKYKLKKGEKPPTKHAGIVDKLVSKIIEGRRLDSRPELTLQNIFANVSVAASKNMGLINDSIAIFCDGTCIETGASTYGRKTCKCKNNGIYNCDCNHKFSNPLAT